jgi:hypothetical protein
MNWRSRQQDDSKGEGHPRVWLMGDAIHASAAHLVKPQNPNFEAYVATADLIQGMGGNQAMLDCADLLPEILKLNARTNSGQALSLEEIRSACNQYEDVQACVRLGSEKWRGLDARKFHTSLS